MDGMEIGARVWVESEEGFNFGPGQAALLRNIMELGSLSKAAKHMGMSYRRAWGRIKKMESTSGQALVYKSGGNKSGFKLTEYGESLVLGYEKWAEEVAAYARKKAQALLPGDFRPVE